MKKLNVMIIAIIVAVFASCNCQAQTQKTDLELAEMIIGKAFSSLSQTFEVENIEHYITSDNDKNATIYVVIGNSVRLWEVKHEDLFRSVQVNGEYNSVKIGEDLISEIFIRYRHSNLNDLRDFHKYTTPKNTEYRQFEHSLGEKISHFRVEQK